MIRVLRLVINEQEYYDEENNLFISVTPCVLELEHSLISLSKWESKWEVPFLSNKELTYEQQLDYIRCMTLNEVPSNAYMALTSGQIKEVFEYISKKMTATVIKQNPNVHNGKSNEFITAELIYWWMASLQIPFEPCERWHLNRLLTLIEVGSIKSQPPKKMGRHATASMNSKLNAARRQALGTSG